MTKRPGIDHYRRDAVIWSVVGGFLQSVNVLLGLVAVVLTLTVASKPFGPSAPYTMLGYFAAVATAALTFVKAEHRGKAWSAAGRRLEDAVGRYDVDPTYTYDHVQSAREEAVKLSAE